MRTRAGSWRPARVHIRESPMPLGDTCTCGAPGRRACQSRFARPAKAGQFREASTGTHGQVHASGIIDCAALNPEHQRQDRGDGRCTIAPAARASRQPACGRLYHGMAVISSSAPLWSGLRLIPTRNSLPSSRMRSDRARRPSDVCVGCCVTVALSPPVGDTPALARTRPARPCRRRCPGASVGAPHVHASPVRSDRPGVRGHSPGWQ